MAINMLAQHQQRTKSSSSPSPSPANRSPQPSSRYYNREYEARASYSPTPSPNTSPVRDRQIHAHSHAHSHAQQQQQRPNMNMNRNRNMNMNGMNMNVNMNNMNMQTRMRSSVSPSARYRSDYSRSQHEELATTRSDIGTVCTSNLTGGGGAGGNAGAGVGSMNNNGIHGLNNLNNNGMNHTTTNNNMGSVPSASAAMNERRAMSTTGASDINLRGGVGVTGMGGTGGLNVKDLASRFGAGGRRSTFRPSWAKKASSIRKGTDAAAADGGGGQDNNNNYHGHNHGHGGEASAAVADAAEVKVSGEHEISSERHNMMEQHKHPHGHGHGPAPETTRRRGDLRQSRTTTGNSNPILRENSNIHTRTRTSSSSKHDVKEDAQQETSSTDQQQQQQPQQREESAAAKDASVLKRAHFWRQQATQRSSPVNRRKRCPSPLVVAKSNPTVGNNDTTNSSGNGRRSPPVRAEFASSPKMERRPSPLLQTNVNTNTNANANNSGRLSPRLQRGGAGAGGTTTTTTNHNNRTPSRLDRLNTRRGVSPRSSRRRTSLSPERNSPIQGNDNGNDNDNLSPIRESVITPSSPSRRRQTWDRDRDRDRDRDKSSSFSQMHHQEHSANNNTSTNTSTSAASSNFQTIAKRFARHNRNDSQQSLDSHNTNEGSGSGSGRLGKGQAVAVTGNFQRIAKKFSRIDSSPSLSFDNHTDGSSSGGGGGGGGPNPTNGRKYLGQRVVEKSKPWAKGDNNVSSETVTTSEDSTLLIGETDADDDRPRQREEDRSTMSENNRDETPLRSHFWKDKMASNSRQKSYNHIQSSSGYNRPASSPQERRQGKAGKREIHEQSKSGSKNEDRPPSRSSVDQECDPNMRKPQSRSVGVSEKAHFWINQQQRRPSPIKGNSRTISSGSGQKLNSTRNEEPGAKSIRTRTPSPYTESASPSRDAAPMTSENDAKNTSHEKDSSGHGAYKARYTEYMSRNRERNAIDDSSSTSSGDEFAEMNARERDKMRNNMRRKVSSFSRQKVRSWPPSQGNNDTDEGGVTNDIDVSAKTKSAGGRSTPKEFTDENHHNHVSKADNLDKNEMQEPNNSYEISQPKRRQVYIWPPSRNETHVDDMNSEETSVSRHGSLARNRISDRNSPIGHSPGIKSVPSRESAAEISHSSRTSRGPTKRSWPPSRQEDKIQNSNNEDVDEANEEIAELPHMARHSKQISDVRREAGRRNPVKVNTEEHRDRVDNSQETRHVHAKKSVRSWPPPLNGSDEGKGNIGSFNENKSAFTCVKGKMNGLIRPSSSAESANEETQEDISTESPSRLFTGSSLARQRSIGRQRQSTSPTLRQTSSHISNSSKPSPAKGSEEPSYDVENKLRQKNQEDDKHIMRDEEVGRNETREEKPVYNTMTKLQQYNRRVKSQVQTVMNPKTVDVGKNVNISNLNMTPASTATTLTATVGSSFNEDHEEDAAWTSPERQNLSKSIDNNDSQSIADTSAILPVNEVKRRLWDDGENLICQKDDTVINKKQEDLELSSTFKSRYYRAAEIAQRNSERNSGSKIIPRTNSMHEPISQKPKSSKANGSGYEDNLESTSFSPSKIAAAKAQAQESSHAQLVQMLSSVRRDDPNALAVIDSILQNERRNLAMDSLDLGNSPRENDILNDSGTPVSNNKVVKQRYNFVVDDDEDEGSEYSESDYDEDSDVSSITNPTYMSAFDNSFSNARKQQFINLVNKDGRLSPAYHSTRPSNFLGKKQQYPTKRPSRLPPLKPSIKDPSIIPQNQHLQQYTIKNREKKQVSNESYESEGHNTSDNMVSPHTVHRDCHTPVNQGIKSDNTVPSHSPMKALKAGGSSTNNRGLLNKFKDWDEDSDSEEMDEEFEEEVRPGTPTSPSERLKRLANAANNVGTGTSKQEEQSENRRFFYPPNDNAGSKKTSIRKGTRGHNDWESVDRTKNFFGSNQNDALSESMNDAFGNASDSFGAFATPNLAATRELERKYSRVEQVYHK